jgi:DNA-binding MarR family transcriptional regulator
MSTPSGPAPDPALRLLDVFKAYERAFARWARSLVEGVSGTPARMRLLGTLHCKGPRIMSGLGDELGVTARQVTNLVDALEAEGLVRRADHPTDRRATVVEVTREGGKLAEQLWQPFREKLAGLYRELPESDQRELLRLLETLLDGLRQRTQGGG